MSSKKKGNNNSNKVEGITVKGCLVTEALGGDKFKVKMPNEQELVCYIGGKLRQKYIRIIPFDKVTIELSPYDVMNNGRIVYREKEK